MKFGDIGSFADLQKLSNTILKEGTKDSENSSFELKGAESPIGFTRSDKANLAREICAFANTYGGLLVFHAGRKASLSQFDATHKATFHSAIESWLKDSIEPPLIGIRLKWVEGIYLFDVPQSETKPHRTVAGREYLYRSNSLSTAMPEVAVSAMYRSQASLKFSAELLLARDTDSQCLQIIVDIKNHSNLAGTRLKVQFQIFSRQKISFEIEPYLQDLTKVRSPFYGATLPPNFHTLCVGETSPSAEEKILYPMDSVSIFGRSKNPVPGLNSCLVRLDVFFIESRRHTWFGAFQFLDPGVCSVKVWEPTANDMTLDQFLERWCANETLQP